jgi:hypothetical protein
MSIKPHLLDDETILDHCTTQKWAWVCTDQRVIKYRSGRGSAEQLHDLSFDEITSISLVNKGRKDELGGYGVFAVVIGLVLGFFLTQYSPGLGLGLLLIFFGIGLYFLYRWVNSEEAYFEFHGSGLLQETGGRWRIDYQNIDNTGEIREFVQAVREQL